MDDMSPFSWPGGARCAVMLTFDFDAETLWLSRDPENARRPGVLSQGIYGAKTGVPKILELLREEGIKATFFTPGWTAEKYSQRMEQIVAGGHEIGHHGYLHEWIDPDYPEKELEALEKGIDALKRVVGVRPVGYRSPGGETSDNMIRLLQQHGFVYDSSLMDQVMPYRHVLSDGGRGPLELPWHWSLDDAPYALFSMKSPRAIMTNSHILDIWTEEFAEIYRWGGLVNVVMHPQVTGRPSRLAMLRAFIAHVKRSPDVWFATGSQVAEAWAAQEIKNQ
ncbi:polysaccharide deacetylase family protein [Hoeflea sp.]|uniref:polysaccharide deacetylase family protein n=1 Tax=Hoeflea sp. TaxID=1940281 RepID=UPI003A94D892